MDVELPMRDASGQAPVSEPRLSERLPLRDLPRLARIVRVLVQQGWGHYVKRMRLKWVAGEPAVRGEATESLVEARRVREALEALGPTFIKFGQALSVRQDLFAPDVIEELAQLQDRVPAFSVEQARAIVSTELGAPIEQLFRKFEDAPLAAASIAQVHRATLPGGEAVVVKVQRPGIEEVIQADLNILYFLARQLHRHVPESRRFDPVGLIEEFADTISQELNFLREAQNADRFREQFESEPSVYVPQVFWRFSTRRVLTMELSTGERLGPGSPPDTDARRRLADTIMHLFLSQVFEHGFFHGDPHPGNLFLMPDGRLCFHDFGIVGRLSSHDQENLRELFLAVVARDAEWMGEVWLEMGIAPPEVDQDAFVHDLAQALERYYAAAQEYSFGAMMSEFMRLGARHRVRMPRQFVLVAKAFMTVESLVRTLNPRFDVLAAFRRYVPHILREQVQPASVQSALTKGYRVQQALRDAAAALPGALRNAVRVLRRGEATVHVRHDLDSLQQHIDRASNRVSFSLIIAAIVIGSSIVMSFHTGPHYRGIPLLGLIGYVLAAALGLGWAIAILRSGKF